MVVDVWGCDGGNKVHSYLLQLTIAKSPVCDSEGFVVTIEEKGLLLDWVATGTKNNCLSSHPISFPKTKVVIQDAMNGFSLTAELSNRQLQGHGDPTSISLTVRSCTEGTGLYISNTVPVTLMFTHYIVQVLLWSFLDSTQAPENQLLYHNKLVKPVVNTGVHKVH